jgi:hypothetical protein
VPADGHREKLPVAAEAVRLRARQQRGVPGEQFRGVIGGGGLGDDLARGDRGVQPARAEGRPRDVGAGQRT